MTLSNVWLDRRQLKILHNNLENVGSLKIKKEIGEYLNHSDSGVYLGNLLSDECLLELELLNNSIMIMPLCLLI